MFRLASNRRPFLTALMTLAPGAVAIASIAWAFAMPMVIDANHTASRFQAASQSGPAERPEEAPTGFNNLTNGFEGQDAFDKDRGTFEEVEVITDGLGPVYNSTSCVSCHQNPVTGSSS